MSNEINKKQLIEEAEKKRKVWKGLICGGAVLLLIMGIIALFGIAPDDGPMVLGWLGIALIGVGIWKLVNAPTTEDLKRELERLEKKQEAEKRNEELKPLVKEFWPENDVLAIRITGEKQEWMDLYRVSMSVENGEIRMKCKSSSRSTSFPVKYNEGSFYVLSKSGDIYPITDKQVNMGTEIYAICKNEPDLSIIYKAYEQLFSNQDYVAIKSGAKPLNEVAEDIRSMMPHNHFKIGQSSIETDLQLGASIVDNYFCAFGSTSREAFLANRTVYEYYKENGLPEYGTNDIVYRSEALSLELSRLDLAMTQFGNKRGTGDVPEVGGDPSMWISQINSSLPLFKKLKALEKTTKYSFNVSRCRLSNGQIAFELENVIAVTEKTSVRYKVRIAYTGSGNVLIAIDDSLYVVDSPAINEENLAKYESKDLLPINHNSSVMKEVRAKLSSE